MGALVALFTLPLVGGIIDFLTLTWAYLLRLAAGAYLAEGAHKSRRPEQMLELYELEQDEDCRSVRETLSTLDLDVLIKPCPRGGSRFMQERKRLAQKDASLPMLHDPNTTQVLSNASAINEYLWKRYGNKASPGWAFRLANFSALGSLSGRLASAIRPAASHGWTATPTSKKPEKALVLWGSEGSPFVARVREALCALEIEYVYKTTPKFTSTKRKEWVRRFGNQLSKGRKAAGLIQIPLLEDPNTGKELLESTDIAAYLYEEYSP
ncbi:Hypothetical Protein FCC1311_106412 [Hondaea fermentalgiana]|uniref:GST N-terminal domain-containing protein n=1 Tax=Hondaea fermentalgiana TaxID=2315210 RepID=A0A2R5GU72_9STRA|nr:Hypothetical Protein FCC1311_106412 [Hondaea fermentalgiana]|eukprot:GBG34417.1 Hypothetical Protein FCC1311_106412 [Hondaea fermentalgiana]